MEASAYLTAKPPLRLDSPTEARQMQPCRAPCKLQCCNFPALPAKKLSPRGFSLPSRWANRGGSHPAYTKPVVVTNSI